MTTNKNIDNEEEDLVKDDNLRKLYILLGLVAFVWGLSYVLIYCFVDKTDRGTFGDTFGAINSLFSGLAFAGIIYTILLQRRELELQRKELIETRKELERSATAQETSGRELRRQAENLKMTAKLNALSTLVSFYNDRESKFIGKNEAIVRGIDEQRQIYLNRIIEILNKKEND
jgi:hypothetical protein